MSNYTKTTDFAIKDSLLTGNPLKQVKGTEIDTEFNNLVSAVATKTDNATAAITGGTINNATIGVSTPVEGHFTTLSATGHATLEGVTSTGATGTGALVFATSPALVTPALGTPSSGTVTNLTGTASININGTVGATTPTTGAFTTLSATGHATLEGVTSTGATGTGALVFATSPALVTPALGTPVSGNLANCTFPTLNQNTTGSSASCTGNAATATNVAGTGVTGTTLASNVVTSSLTTVGALNAGAITSGFGSIDVGTGSVKSGNFVFPSIQATLPTITIVDHCFHLAKDDTDKGAWRKKKGQSWRSEARTAGKYMGSYATALAAVNAQSGAVDDYYYNTTTAQFEAIATITGTVPSATAATSAVTYRAGREDYPTNALVTAEAGRVIIWDLDGSQPAMWGVLKLAATTITSIYALNNAIVFGFDSGLWGFNLATSRPDYRYNTTAHYFYQEMSFATYALFAFPNIGNVATPIVNNTANDVAITILPDAPLDEYGMPVPTIAVATAGGVSVIKHDGTVVNSTYTGAYYAISFNKDGTFNAVDYTSGGIRYFDSPANLSAGFINLKSLTAATIPAVVSAISSSNKTATGNVSYAYGQAGGLNLIVMNRGTPANSLIAHVSSTHNTGYMVGDIRGAWLADSVTDTVSGVGAVADRSVKNVPMDVVGTLTRTASAGGRSIYSGFSVTNYLQQASNANWNALGTGDFSIMMSGVKWGTVATLKTILSIGNGVSAGSVEVEHLAANTLRVSIWNATPTKTTICTSTATFTDTAEHVVEVKRYTQSGVANTVAIVVDGVVVASAVSTLTISNATGSLRIGEGQAAAQSWAGGQVASVRISATAPTAEQSKFIAAQENALNGGQPCLLSNSSNVTALDYKKSEDLLEVVNGTATDYFSGLKRVASGTTTAGITGGNNVPKYALLRSGTTNKFWAAERNISAELQEQVPENNEIINIDFTATANQTSFVLPMGYKPKFVYIDGFMQRLTSQYTVNYDGFIYTVVSGTPLTVGTFLTIMTNKVN